MRGLGAYVTLAALAFTSIGCASKYSTFNLLEGELNRSPGGRLVYSIILEKQRGASCDTVRINVTGPERELILLHGRHEKRKVGVTIKEPIRPAMHLNYVEFEE
jgi:hypothetical protein